MKDEIDQLKSEVSVIKAESVQLKNDNLKGHRVDTSTSLRRHKLKVSKWSGITYKFFTNFVCNMYI